MKRKEKQMSLEEIKARVTETEAPLWIHSAPLFSLYPTPEGLRVLTLSEAADQGLLILFFVDLVDYSFDAILATLERFHQEYRGLGWKAVLVFEQKYLFLKDAPFLDRFRHSKIFAQTPLYRDQKGEWFETFGAKAGARIVLMNRGAEVVSSSLASSFTENLQSLERTLQDALRLEDPGLPLIEVRSHLPKTALDRRIIGIDAVTLNGNWIQGSGSAMSEDSGASLSIPFEGSKLRLIANTHPSARENTRFMITLNDEPLPSAHYGSNVRLAEKGSAVSEIDKSHGIFELISAQSPLKGIVKIRFLNAVENPVVLYGLRSA